MIAPLAPYAIRGAIWYQGEANAGRGRELYGLRLKTLIDDWRNLWRQGDFPFLCVQLANWDGIFRANTPQQSRGDTSGWPYIRDDYRRMLSRVPNTGMAVAIDIGDPQNIHPKNKQEVGRRLAAWALVKVYGREGTASGPLYKSMRREAGKLTVEFDYLGGGLVAHGASLQGFVLAGKDRQFRPADAVIHGDCVVVARKDTAEPVAVRYGWAANPTCNLYNQAGLPASPFRSDDWEP
jgi:sialate O-acetylesterase